MCGIFGYIGKEKVNLSGFLLDGLQKLEYRGYDSAGIAVFGKRRIFLSKAVGEVSNLAKKVGKRRVSGQMGIGHTRWATHGGVTVENAHPHLDCTGKIVIVHNGIIENYEEIKKKLIGRGHKFISETDSEVAVHLIEEFNKKYDFTEAVRRAFVEFTGLNAIIALSAGGNRLVAAKNGSPLIVGFGHGENFLASDVPALLSNTRQVHFMEDGQIIEVSKDKVKVLSAKTGKKLTLSTQRLTWKIEEAEKGRYPHYMIKEIMEQPKILRSIATGGISQIPDLAKLVVRAYGTYMVGCGTASYAALSGVYLFARIAHRHVNFAVGSEFGYQQDFLTPKSLVIAFSQSGETIDIIESVAKAKQKGAKVLAIVNVLGSTLYRMSDYKFLLGAGPEKCVLSTKTFTAKLATLLLLANALNGGLGQGCEMVEQAASAVEKMLKKDSLAGLKRLAAKIANAEHMFVIGRGQSYPVALEGALKIKEVSYIHAEGLAAGELKHGPIALIEKGTPCLAFLPNDETYGATLSGCMEMKARGAFIIGISPKPHKVFDAHVSVSDCGEATIIPNIVVAQLLGYYLCLEKGHDPDKPRNLAKSVTVK